MTRHSLRNTALALLAISYSASVFALPVKSTEPDVRLSEAAREGNDAEVHRLLLAHVAASTPGGDGSTALHWAAYNEDIAMTRELLLAHADVQAKTRLHAITPLLMASQGGNPAIIALLLEHGADANQADELGTTPLMFAAASGKAEAIKVLLDHGARVNDKETQRGQTALMFAASLNRAEVIQVLMAHGAQPNILTAMTTVAKLSIDKNGKLVVIEPGPMASGDAVTPKPPAQAATTGDQQVDKNQPARSGAKTDTEAEVKPVPPLDPIDAAKQKKRREAGASIVGGMSALLYAARQGNVAATEALIAGGADINLQSGSEHTTPVALAIANGHFDEARVLVEHGADVNLANAMGLTPLYATIDVQYAPHEWSPEPVVDHNATNYLALMKLLLDHGAKVNARLGRQIWERTLSENRSWVDPGGATAFWRAAQANDMKAMQLLKDAGADPTIATDSGVTPLMAAAGVGWSPNYDNTTSARSQAVEYCFKMGNNPDARDTFGNSALHGAAIVGDANVIHFLVDHGAKTDARTKAGDYVADLANGPFEKSVPHPEIVALLEKLGSPNSHNCRSSECVVPVKEDKPVEGKGGDAPAPPKAVVDPKSVDGHIEKKGSAVVTGTVVAP